jgi:hypothetical protein
MRNKKTYLKPAIKVVKMRRTSALLNSSAKMGGYQYQENNGNDGWSDN